jgi:hypothetical protein
MATTRTRINKQNNDNRIFFLEYVFLCRTIEFLTEHRCCILERLQKLAIHRIRITTDSYKQQFHVYRVFLFQNFMHELLSFHM